MKLQIRKIIESDWNFLPSWWKKYNDKPIPRAFLPENGLGGFMVCKESDPIGCMFLYTTNSKTAIPGVTVSDKDYRDNDRDEALQLLLDFTVKFAEDLGFKYSWVVANENMLLKKYEKNGFTKFGKPCYELLKKY
tara:strand:- start:10394 stop:10798 length:405 start_codon:yes stop_codon:yes gene_type:complete